MQVGAAILCPPHWIETFVAFQYMRGWSFNHAGFVS
jgi:hypothetical protein